MIAPDDFWFSL